MDAVYLLDFYKLMIDQTVKNEVDKGAEVAVFPIVTESG
jgi:hypothetical protein